MEIGDPGPGYAPNPIYYSRKYPQGVTELVLRGMAKGRTFFGAGRQQFSSQGGGRLNQTPLGMFTYKPGFKRKRFVTMSRLMSMKEKKFLDSAHQFSTVSLDGEFNSTSNQLTIPQGVTESTRVGRKIMIWSVSFRFTVTVPVGSDNQEYDFVRIIVYKDKQCNGEIPLVTDLLESTAWNSENNLANKGRFQFLYDKKVHITHNNACYDGATISASGGQKHFQFTKYFKGGIPIEFTSTTGALSERTSNDINVMAISSQGVGSLYQKCRTRYTDA